MALIKCPECGREISDKAKACIHCGYPLKTESLDEKYNFGFESVQEDNRQEGNKARIQNKNIIIIIGITILALICIISLILFRKNSKLSISEISINKWKLIDEGKYYDFYEGTVNSNETKPFMAVIGYYEESDKFPMFVYMENGKGIIQINETSDDDPSIKYNSIGYLNGKKVKESDVKSINYDDSDYNDWIYETSCVVTIEIEMKNKEDGLLFIELNNDLTKDIDKNIAIAIVDGRGKYSYHLDGLPFKARGVEVTAIPKFFCNATKLEETDYVVETPFAVEKDEGEYSTSFSGKEELVFSGYNKGLILYTEELLDGGKKERRGELIRKVAYLNNNQCTLSTYMSGDSDEKLLTPTYEIQIVGYLEWEKYSK